MKVSVLLLNKTSVALQVTCLSAAGTVEEDGPVVRALT